MANWYLRQIQFAHIGGYQLRHRFLDPNAAHPLYEQLCRHVRTEVRNGKLRPGDPLPSSRDWSERLGVSRTTILTALDQLRAEGYLESRPGGEVCVSAALPEELTRPPAPAPPKPRATPPTWTGPRNYGRPRPFQMAVPALDAFPYREWGRLAAKLWRKPPLELLNYPSPGGFPPLRRAIADYLAAHRGVHCDPGQIIVTAGSQQALNLACQRLIQPRDSVWMENPGYYAARLAMERAAAVIHPIAVDDDGLDVEQGIRIAPRARLVYVTPSSQCPIGCRLSLERRLKLLHWAALAGAWLIEDEYESEYRFSGRPLPSLQSLDQGGRVLYAGSFSLLLYPSLRIGFIVAPPPLVDEFLAARAQADWNSSAIDQAILAEFISEGLLSRHLRRMRVLYAERRHTLITQAGRMLSGRVEMQERPEGLHVLGLLHGPTEKQLVAAAADEGVFLRPLSMYTTGKPSHPAVLFGFAPFDATATRHALATLRSVEASATRPRKG